MATPKPFAKLFTHPEIGQVLVQRTSNDDDAPGVEVKFDPGIEGLAPSHLFLSVGGGDDEAAEELADLMFEGITEDGAIKAAIQQIAVIRRAVGRDR